MIQKIFQMNRHADCHVQKKKNGRMDADKIADLGCDFLPFGLSYGLDTSTEIRNWRRTLRYRNF